LAYAEKRGVESQMLEDYKLEVKKKAEENEKLKGEVDELQKRIKAGATGGALPNGSARLYP